MRAWLRRLPPNVQGALWLVSGGFIFTTNGMMIRLLSAEVESVQTAFFRAFFSVLMLLPLMLSGRVKPWHSQRKVGHFWRTVMGTVSMVLGFYAVSMLPLADATALAFSQPLFSVVVAALIVGEKVRWRRWGATLVGFVGVLVMVRPGAGSLQPGAIVALTNAMTVALSILLVKRLSEFGIAADDSDPVRHLLDLAARGAGDLGVALAVALGLGAGGWRVGLGDSRPVFLGAGLQVG